MEFDLKKGAFLKDIKAYMIESHEGLKYPECTKKVLNIHK